MAGPQVTKLLARMRQEHYELGIAIDVFDRLSNGHSKRQSADMMEAALEMASENGDDKPPKKAKKAKKAMKPSKRKRDKRYRGVGMGVHVKPLPEVEPIPGLDVTGMKLTQAVPAALKALNEPVDARSLTAYLRHAGSPVADVRGVATTIAMMVRKRLAKVRRNPKTGMISLGA